MIDHEFDPLKLGVMVWPFVVNDDRLTMHAAVRGVVHQLRGCRVSFLSAVKGELDVQLEGTRNMFVRSQEGDSQEGDRV